MNIEIIHLDDENLKVEHINGEEYVILSGRYRIKTSRSYMMRLLSQFHRAESFEELRDGFGNNDRFEPDLHTD